MPGNPIAPINRTYLNFLAAINADSQLVDKPEWFKRMIAGIGDNLSINLDLAYNQAFLRTALTRKAMTDLCALIDYQLSPASTASGTILFYVASGASFPFTVTAANLIASSAGTTQVSAKKYQARAAATFTADTRSFTASGAVITASADVVYTGHRVRLSSTVTLPPPLAAGRDYYLTRTGALTCSICNTLADALTGTAITTTGAGSGTHTMQIYSKAVSVYQQEDKASSAVGKSDGTAWQEFDLPDKLVIATTVAVVINSVTWTNALTAASISTDKHYRILYRSDGTAYLQFGDGTYGAIPATSADVFATYSVGGGADSNLSAYNAIQAYSGSDSNLNGASNATMALTGGADEESLENAKRVAPLLVKAQDRFVTVSDGIALTLAYGGVAQAIVIRNEFGPRSCGVYGVANGGGSPGGALRSAIQTYLIDRSELGSIDVRFGAGTFTAENVVSDAKVLAGYTWANVQRFFGLAWCLFLDATTKEIVDAYYDGGVATATAMINTIHGTLLTTSFTAADYDNVLLLLKPFVDGRQDPRNFGDTLYSSDAISYIQANVAGIDYFTITTPSFGTGIVLAASEISTVGSLTLGAL